MDAPPALADLRVVDLSTGVAGAFASKLLADLGADVVLVEPSGGSPLRAQPPLAPDGPDGALWVHLSGGKRSVVPAGGDDAAVLLADLLWAADVVFVDGTSPWERHLPTSPPEHLVVVDIAPFGRSGPYAGWRGSDLAVWALGGYLHFTGAPDREPVWLPGHQAALHAGAHAAFAALAAVEERRRSGRGQHVEVSQWEAVLAAHVWLVSSWTACGQALGRVPPDLIRCADGWVYVMRIVPNDNLFVLIERPDLAEEGFTVDVPTWFANIPRVFEAVAEWAADKKVADVVEFGQLLRIAVTPVLDAAGVAADDQLAARDWWEREGTLRLPGAPYKLSATPARRRGPAPALDGDTVDVRRGLAPVAAQRRVASPRTSGGGGAGPLAGLRVVEVTTNWAGPSCGRHLADLGADVVKVEWATKPATRTLFWVGPAQDFQRQPWHRSMYFAELNRNKRDVCIDLAHPQGREAFLALVRTADVLIENNSARVMPNLGLDWATLHEANPRLVMVSMSGYGAEGPRRDWLAYGANIEATSSLTSVTGYPDGQLSRTTLFYADPVTGILGAVGALAAIAWRHRSGEGQWVEMALNEAGASFCMDALLRHAATGQVRRPSANRDDRFAPHGVYPAIGVDHWVAIAVQDDRDWLALCEVMGRPDLAADPTLASLDGRQARHDELDAAIAAWTATLEQYEVAWSLQRRGVSAAPVLANWQILPDPHLHDRGVYQPVVHPVIGVYPMTTWPWRFARTPARIDRPAPLFAEHNREVLREAGYDDHAIEELYASGVTADDPAVG